MNKLRHLYEVDHEGKEGETETLSGLAYEDGVYSFTILNNDTLLLVEVLKDGEPYAFFEKRLILD